MNSFNNHRPGIEVAKNRDCARVRQNLSASATTAKALPILCALVIFLADHCCSVAQDWSMWGGSPARNNTPIGKHIPDDWDVGRFNRKAKKHEGLRNIKWTAVLGSQSYGNPVVAGGRVFVGTNNGAAYLKRYPYKVDLGCLLCFRESDGKFLWQHSNEKLPTGRLHDQEMQGVCSAPLVEGKRLWYVSNRGEVVCLDIEGFYDDEDDGPVKGEWVRLFNVAPSADPDAPNHLTTATNALAVGKLTNHVCRQFERVDVALPGTVMPVRDGTNRWTFKATVHDHVREFRIRKEGRILAFYAITTPSDKSEADVVWRFNMMTKLGVSQHNMATCSPTSFGDVLFICTSNGVDETQLRLPAPDAPSFIALDKNTGKVLWTDRSPGKNILEGQWASPAVAELGGVPQVLFPGGDGWLYSFRADKWDKENFKPIPLWKFDGNPKESRWILGGRGNRNGINSFPVIHDGFVFLAMGQNPDFGEGEGHLWCIDPTKRGDVSAELAVKRRDKMREPIPHKRFQAVDEKDGEIAIPNPNSAAVWHYDQFDQNRDGKIDFEETFHRCVGSPVIKDDLLFIADFSGVMHCIDAKTGRPHWTYDMLSAAWASPLVVDGKVYIGDEDGDVFIFHASADPRETMKDAERAKGEKKKSLTAEPFREINMDNSIYSTPIVANNVLYVSNRSHLFAIHRLGEEGDKTKGRK